MAITHILDPIVDPKRLFEGFESLLPPNGAISNTTPRMAA
jgi:hypothetical protein